MPTTTFIDKTIRKNVKATIVNSQEDVNGNDMSIGSITLDVQNPSGTYQYSRDNGNTWQTSKVFAGLTAGIYNVAIRSNVTRPAIESTPITVELDPSV